MLTLAWLMSVGCSFSVAAATQPGEPLAVEHTAQASQAKTAKALLVLSPAICAIAKGEQMCTESVAAVWHLPKASSPCLYRSDLDAALRCWHQEVSGDLKADVSTNTELVFQLKENGAVLAEAMFRVLWEEQQRRRRHKPWQFF